MPTHCDSTSYLRSLVLASKYGYDLENKSPSKAKGEYLDDLEQRLRTCVILHRSFIFRGSADVSEVRKVFVSSLKQMVTEVDSIASYDDHQYIKIASIDVNVRSVHNILVGLQQNAKLRPFVHALLGDGGMDGVLDDEGNDHFYAKELGFETRTHVTLAHYLEMPQDELRAQFLPHVDSEIQLHATALLWSETVMALRVRVDERTSHGAILPPCKNAFVHITVWCAEGTAPYEANNLPALYDANAAQCIDFETPIVLAGVISLWHF
jgi:Fungal tRNA ligase phosphodiesterase domain